MNQQFTATSIVTWKLLAQDMFSSRRITKVVRAQTEAQAWSMVAVELDEAGFYPLSAAKADSTTKTNG